MAIALNLFGGFMASFAVQVAVEFGAAQNLHISARVSGLAHSSRLNSALLSA